MKTLYVLRHAKAERDAPSGEDYDRPLAARGRDDAARLGKVLKKNLTNWPDIIVSSPSARTLETVEHLTAAWSKPPAIQTDEKLYLAPASRLLETVRKLSDTAGSAMLVGHNPGMEELAIQLANKVASDALYRMRTKFPTCALATFEISTDSWARVSPDLARLVSFSTPKDPAPNHLADRSGA
jgi:phosphohistidine phosphatase